MKVHLFAAVLCVFVVAGFAQTNTGMITGQVLDSQGGGVPGAHVVLTAEETSVRTATKTESTGNFFFPSVQPGRYRVSVEAAGFKRFEKKDVALSSAERLSVGTLILEIGSLSESVTVSGEATPVQVSSQERSVVLNEKQMAYLSTPGRDYMNMLKVMPGVLYPDGAGGNSLGTTTPPNIGGIRTDYTSTNLDGVVANNRGVGANENQVNIDAVAEVKVLTSNYQAEYGKNAGAIINIVTKSGTQAFHGTGYWYKRHEMWNANNFINNSKGVSRDIYRYNTIGSNVGGPIWLGQHFNHDKDKLFFFFSQEYQPNKRPGGIQTFTVPTELERKGDFSQSSLKPVDPQTGKAFTNNAILTGRINTDMQKLLNVFPLPNVTGNAAYNLLLTDTIDVPVHQELLRVDYNPTPKWRSYFRGMNMFVGQRGSNITANSNKWGVVQSYDTTNPNVAANLTYMASPTLVNELAIGLSRWTEDQAIADSELAKLERAKLGIRFGQVYPINNPLNLLPASSFGGVQNAISIGYDSRFPMKDIVTAWSISDSVTKVHGSHTFKAGAYFEIAEYLQAHTGGSFTGSLNFGVTANNPFDSKNPFSNALLGNFQSYQEINRRIDYDPINHVFEFYGQDNWKVNKHLTLDYGVRFTVDLPQIFKKDIGGNFDPAAYNRAKLPLLYVPGKDATGTRVAVDPTTGKTYPQAYIGLFVPGTGDYTVGSIAAGTPGYPRGFVESNGLVPAPRIGFAYDPAGNGKTAIRGGFGIILNARARSGQQGDLSSNPPARYQPQIIDGNVDSILTTTGLIGPSSFGRVVDRHQRVLSTYSMSLGVQRQIGFNSVLDVAYVANLGRHLGQEMNINQVPYGTRFLPSSNDPTTNKPLPDDFLRPYYGYNSLPFYSNNGTSSYHSLQVQLRRSFRHGLQYGVAYTWSRAMDYGDSYNSTVATTNNWRYWNYGPAGFDRTQQLVVNWVYDIPNASNLVHSPIVKAIFDHWQTSGIYAWATGFPRGVSLTLTDGADLTGGGDGVPSILGSTGQSGNVTGTTAVLTGSARLSGEQQNFYHWFNTSVFRRPQVGERGSGAAATRDAFRAPGINNWEMSFFKNIRVKERLAFQIRWEMYNAFNHTQFSDLDVGARFDASGKQTNTQFGQITAARNPRIQQLALRFTF
jgi:carboxypeptidase family protein/TonB-dependent receptor-like protein